MKKRKNQKGSLTVEAALCLPMFMAFILLISCITRVYFIHEVVQDALSDAVNEFASTAYILELTGVADTRNELKGILQDKADVVYSDQETFMKLVDITKRASDDVQALDLGALKASANDASAAGKTAAGSVQEAMADPRGYAKSLAAAGLDIASQKGEETLMNYYIKNLMRKHLETSSESADERLTNVHIADGIKGLSFEGSTYFDGDEQIDVYVHYTFERIDPFGLIKNVTLTNHVHARAWMTGEGEMAEGEPEEADVAGGAAVVEVTDPVEEVEETVVVERPKESTSSYRTDNWGDSEIAYADVKMYFSKDTEDGKTSFFHTSNICGSRVYDWNQFEGTYIDVPKNNIDKFEHEGKNYTLCTKCAKGLFSNE